MPQPDLFLRDRRTKVIYFGIDGSVWHMSGFGQGREGVELGVDPGSFYMPDMELLWLEGARQDGATYQDTVFSKREMDFQVHIKGDSVGQFHRRNDAWWRAWSPRIPGTLAFHSPHTGWRWIRVRLAGNVNPAWKKDPALIRAYDYDMTIAADNPLYRSFAYKAHWQNSNNAGSGALQITNWADERSYPVYTMPGPGQYYIQDGPGGPMLKLPYITFGQTMRLDTINTKLSLRIFDVTTGLDGRSAWKGMGTKRPRGFLEPYSSNVIKVAVEKGTENSQIYAVSTPRFLRPF